MVQVTYNPPFLSDEFFLGGNPSVCKIVNAGIVPNEKFNRNEVQVLLANKNHEARMSVYGLNLKLLIDTFGDDTDSWKGQTILLTQTQEKGKTKRLISVPARQA